MKSELKFRNSLKKKWLVIYVRPRWEKKVYMLLQEQDIESFCPTTTTENQWADRKKMVTTPLFTGYVFVRINDRDLTKVRYAIGVLNFIYFMGKPAVIRDIEIEQLKTMVNNYNNLQVVNLNELSAGDRVRIKSGLFHNQEGKIIQIQGKNVLMSFDHLDCALVSCVPIGNIVKADAQNNLCNTL
ncbi:MAG: UpxY family transcription antiterminator [Flavobacterium sp.]|nr:MAG: UpxY family transcription antiterminator [Flavobacterium sp.]